MNSIIPFEYISLEANKKIISSFSRWWIKPNFQIWKTLNKQMKKKINNHEKTILGFRSTIPLDESEKIDLKT